MNRDEVEKILNNEDTLDYGSQSGFECEMISNLIDKIYDDFEKDLKDINNQVSRLKKQLSKGHHIECSCSFCKPVDVIISNYEKLHCPNCQGGGCPICSGYGYILGKEIKNCNNCKFSTLFKYDNNYLKCKNGDISSRKININLDEIVSVLDKDFCCNKWELKC